MFANIRRMETYGNIHGFSQNKNATTWLDSNSNLTGDINNDTNNFDTHMLKNMEWGAVTYLANSKYGKQGNSNYTDFYKEIYLNNNSNYKTGYSGGSYDSGQSTSETYLYNNLTSNGTGQGYKGAGASTTGDVYGVFDMSGGTWDYVMANVSDSSGSLYPSSSGTWTSSNRLNQKYYDQYSKNYQKDGNLMVSKLGDAIREVKKDATTKNLWFTDEALAYSASYQSSESWFMRGASTVYYNDISRDSIGIFATERYTGAGAYSNNQSYYTSRPVLAVFRDMPWKDNN